MRKKDLFGEKKFMIEIKRFNTAHHGRLIIMKEENSIEKLNYD